MSACHSRESISDYITTSRCIYIYIYFNWSWLCLGDEFRNNFAVIWMWLRYTFVS